MSVSIGNVAVFVSDLTRSEAFYTALGLEVIARIETPRYREVIVRNAAEGSQLMLATDAEHGGPVQPSGFWKVYLATDDAAGLYRRALEAGGTSVAEPYRLEQFNITIGMVADPDGYVVELGQRH
ncbi:MAG TPA: VOC family protein [Acidimicrobiales bacterium]|nr:VOC family protein [Acidimicrobiales bacterium]